MRNYLTCPLCDKGIPNAATLRAHGRAAHDLTPTEFNRIRKHGNRRHAYLEILAERAAARQFKRAKPSRSRMSRIRRWWNR